jgi:cellulose 1,4-beta-cellobiosidase
VSSTACTVLVSTLINSPFSLPWGSSIYAQVVAINAYGSSLTSNAGNGAVIIEYADKPMNLQETVSARAATSITFTWVPGPLIRGSAVVSYQIFRAVASVGNYTSIATGITSLSYTATGLTTGETYSF